MQDTFVRYINMSNYFAEYFVISIYMQHVSIQESHSQLQSNIYEPKIEMRKKNSCNAAALPPRIDDRRRKRREGFSGEVALTTVQRSCACKTFECKIRAVATEATM